MQQKIEVIEKPQNISYDILLDVLHEAFQERLDQGLNYTCSYYTKEDMINMTKGGKIIIAIDEQKNILGVLGFDIRLDKKGRKYGYSSYGGVTSKIKSRGVGTMLMQYQIDYNKNVGSEYILADTAINAKSAVRYHIKNGFKIIKFTSYGSTNYYSYVFRNQLKSPSLWNSNIFCKIIYIVSYCKTKLLKTENGYTLFGKLLRNIKHLL